MLAAEIFFLVLEAVLDHATRYLAADVADLALQVADAGFAGVLADDRDDGVVVEGEVLFRQAGCFSLLLEQVIPGDFELFDLGVAVQAQDFHAVLERRRDGVQHVGGGYEQDLREVVVDVEVVILEGRVLLRVEDFEQRRSRVAAEVGGHLVHFVEQEDRILGPGPLHRLDDLARQGADVGAAMAANFGLVAHAAQGKPDELASSGLGDRHAERGLADARRPGKAEDRALGILDQLADGEELKNAFLDLFQSVVVFVEHLFGAARRCGFPWTSSSTARPAASRDNCG